MEKQILFNTRMVKALLEGRKTVTRRDPFQTPENYSRIKGMYRDDKNRLCVLFHCTDPEGPVIQDIHARYQPGDILWVRETWQYIPCADCRQDAVGCCTQMPVVYESADAVTKGCFVYKADYPEPERICWRPSIHMPRAAARIFLRVTSVRVERLQDINLDPPGPENQVVREGLNYLCDFIAVWEMTVKPADRATCGWEANPWVWVIEFERIDREDTTC